MNWNWSWKPLCVTCAVVGGACICIATGGMAAPAIIGWSVAAGYGGFLVGDKADQESAEREKELMKDGRYKDSKGEVDKQEKENEQTKNLVNEIVGKLNGTVPRQKGETDESLNQQLVVALNKQKTGESRLNSLRGDLDKLRKDLGGNQSLATLLGLDKLGFTDKVMIVGGIVLIIYLLKK